MAVRQRIKDPRETDEIQLVMAALADPTRRVLLNDLDTFVGFPISYLMEVFPMSRQALHKHLQVLARAGILIKIKSYRGAGMLYYMDPRPIRRVFADLARRYKRDMRPLNDLHKFGSPDVPWG